jgi:hypothetical protein
MKEFNWVLVFEDEMNRKGVEFDKKCRFLEKHRMIKDSPWIFNKSISVGKSVLEGCTEYHKYFSGTEARLGFIHSYCHDCWKVVVKPKNVKQLMELCDLQADMQYPAKCGIEIRPFVPRLYGGYFYNRSKEQGLECLKKIKRIVREKIDPTMPVLLKRGCTEFEMRFGPSDKWEIQPDQLKFEEEFKKVYVKDIPEQMEMPAYLKSHIKTRWLYWAAQHYDNTYKEYTGGVSLIDECNYVTYHKEVEKSSANVPEKKTTENK